MAFIFAPLIIACDLLLLFGLWHLLAWLLTATGFVLGWMLVGALIALGFFVTVFLISKAMQPSPGTPTPTK